MIKLEDEDIRNLRLIQEDFESLVINIKLAQPWDIQQRYEWSVPDFEMFKELLMACIQNKIPTKH